MNNKLSMNQRLAVTVLYIVIFVGICYFSNKSFDFLNDTNSPYNLLFASGALLLIFGTYITEPYFTKPIDVITNSIAIILALRGINNKGEFIGYDYILYITVVLLALSLLTVILSQNNIVGTFSKVLFKIVTFLGRSKISFSIIYISTLVSYFHNKPIDFIFFLTFWIVFISQFLIEELVIRISNIIDMVTKKIELQESIGVAIGCDNPLLYKVEADYLLHKDSNIERGELVYLQNNSGLDTIGVVVNEKQLLNKKWLSIYFLQDIDGSLLKIKQEKTPFRQKSSIFFKDNLFYKLNLDTLSSEQKDKISNNYFIKNLNKFIGYISHGSNINQVRFELLIDTKDDIYGRLKEGSIVTVDIHNEKVLYQIIDGVTYEENLDKHDKYGYMTGIAQKLGKYNSTNKSIDTVKWVPNIFSPVFFDASEGTATNLAKSIGTLPETSLDIEIKDFHDLVTHNTAVLGILGIGKSCLTFELIKKVIDNTNCKIFCIDITNEYGQALLNYILESDIHQIENDLLEGLKSNNKDGDPDNPHSWGNEEYYKKDFLDKVISDFSDSDKRILILNPDWHNVSKAGSPFKISYKNDLTISEKVRIISERIFLFAKKNRIVSESGQAKYLIVFEEAHSLIPERSSTANDGDKSAVNGTSKVILQGRKYGLGSFVITQRTANISKSILNQCNTIFGLRVFDDTGKQFLENYIGSNYANTLPTLEERHAIVIGKALKLKQPIIIKLNKREDIFLDD